MAQPTVGSTARYFRVKINGEEVRAGDVQLTKSLDQICSVAQFSMVARPDDEPVDTDTVLIELIDPVVGASWPVFGGTVNGIDVESQPWSFRITACDQLEKLRRVRQTSDLDLTGMTEGEAWKAIADACGIDYDDADVDGADSGYVIGAHEDVKWHKDGTTSGAQIIQELDSVFGNATMTIGDNRVIRIHLDEVPDDATGVIRTFTKGTSANFLAHRRSKGNRDQLQNVWNVLGVRREVSKTCTAQSWASAVSGSGYLASRHVRVPAGSFSSDLIQDESLAVAIVERLMKRTNRLPDNATIAALYDPNVHPGSKIKVIDITYGIGTTGAGRLFMVRSVSLQGNTMTLDCQAGPPGDVGTVTHGTEKVCSDTHSTSSIDDGYTEPDVGFPPEIGYGDDDFEFPGGDTDDAPPDEDESTLPLLGCTTDASFTPCDDSSADTCIDGGTDTETVSGTVPDDFCATYVAGDLRLQTKAFSAGGSIPAPFSARCKVLVPWRDVDANAKYHVTADGAIDWVQCDGPSTATLYASTETDPDLQDDSNDATFGCPVINGVAGVVTFNVAGSFLTIRMPSISGGIESSSLGPAITIYADPGLSVTPSGGTTQQFGVVVRTDFQGPILIGDTIPNHSFGGTHRNNGGYVISTPAGLGVAVAFSAYFDETYRREWGRTVASTDLGSGYIDHLDFLSEGHVFPGEPADPGNTCAAEHDAHKLEVILHPGGTGTAEAPAVKLEGLIVGHSTCTVNADYGA